MWKETGRISDYAMVFSVWGVKSNLRACKWSFKVSIDFFYRKYFTVSGALDNLGCVTPHKESGRITNVQRL